MNRSLFFIPILAKAMGQTNPRKALIDAFRQIGFLGKNSEYLNDFAMFSSFMTELGEIWNLQSHLTGEPAASVIEDTTLQLTAEALAKVPFDWKTETDRADLLPGLRKELGQRIKSLSLIDTEPRQQELIVNRDKKTVALIHLVSHEPFHRISGLRPGNYTFELGSGRVLWTVELTYRDLVLKAAFPGKNLRLAADTGEERQVAHSREINVLNGELVFRIYPGLESGGLEIDTRKLR